MAKNVIPVDTCMNCNSCILACAIEHSESKILFKAIQQAAPVVSCIRLQRNKNSFFLKKCKHCEYAPCINSCPVGALRRDPDFGQVIINYSQCISCGICSKVCPQNAIIYISSKVYKCDGCVERRKRDELPACLYACPTGAIKDIFHQG